MNAGPGIRETNDFKKLQRATFLTKADYPRTSRMSLPTTDALRTVIVHHFGEDVQDSDLLARSTLHYVYRISLAGKRVILRINKNSRLYRELSFYSDVWIYSSLTKKNIPAAQVYAVDTRRKIVPWDYEITEDAGLQSLYDLTRAGALPLSKFRKAGMYLARVHAIPVPGWGPIGAEYVRSGQAKGVDKTWRSFVLKNLDMHLSILTKAKILTKDEAKQSFSRFPRVFPRCPSQLLHGDVANHNILPGRNDVVFIDWEDALAGDPIYDVAYFGTGAFDTPEWLTHFLKGYTAVQPLPADFDMRYWLYFLRISIAKAVVRLKEGKDTATPDSLSVRRIRHALGQVSRV